MDVRVKRDTGELDWAMAGVKEWVHKGSDPPKARFTPILTSRPPFPGQTETGDEGTFSSLPNGDTLEVGTMYDPEDGKLKAYKEIWRDLPTSGTAFILEAIDDGATEEESPRVEKAWVAQMGGYQLMVAKLGDTTYAARVAFKDGDQSWRTLHTVGKIEKTNLVHPVNPPDSLWKAGETIESAGRRWLVKECFTVE